MLPFLSYFNRNICRL